MLKICQEIDRLESDADQRDARRDVASCSAKRPTCASCIKLKAIYELLESATDKCQDVANVIEGVVLENA